MYSRPTHAGTPWTPSQNIEPARMVTPQVTCSGPWSCSSSSSSMRPTCGRTAAIVRAGRGGHRCYIGLAVDLQRIAELEIHEPAAPAPRVFPAVVRFGNQLLAVAQAADAGRRFAQLPSRLAHRLLEARERPEDELHIREQAFRHERPCMRGRGFGLHRFAVIANGEQPHAERIQADERHGAVLDGHHAVEREFARAECAAHHLVDDPFAAERCGRHERPRRGGGRSAAASSRRRRAPATRRIRSAHEQHCPRRFHRPHRPSQCPPARAAGARIADPCRDSSDPTHNPRAPSRSCAGSRDPCARRR